MYPTMLGAKSSTWEAGRVGLKLIERCPQTMVYWVLCPCVRAVVGGGFLMRITCMRRFIYRIYDTTTNFQVLFASRCQGARSHVPLSEGYDVSTFPSTFPCT